ncbi:hypothetical protein GLYMA_14G148250v4 [Glycine max]|nr:hypothetical protein GLYMA_14G148250v4 [Glycine max]KAH1094543.1 hypothetical protein GYH30_040009 [Glycine max]
MHHTFLHILLLIPGDLFIFCPPNKRNKNAGMFQSASNQIGVERLVGIILV